MDMKEVYQLIEKFENSSLSELSLELGGVKLAVKKGGTASGNGAWNCGVETASAEQSALVEKSVPTANIVSQGKMSAKESLVVNKDTEKTITAPLVGTFYRAPGPDEKPFVEVGQQVKKGDVVVASIDVEDESLVEYGEVLIRLS